MHNPSTGMYKSPTLSGGSETGVPAATQGIYLGLIMRLDMGTGCVTWSRIPGVEVQLFWIVFSIQGM